MIGLKVILYWGMCRCTVCHCPNHTRNENHLCGACYSLDPETDWQDDHQGLNQITKLPMRNDWP